MESIEKFDVKAFFWSSLAAGLVFGIMMAMMGMIPMIANLIGSDSFVVGFGVHMVISFITGGIFALIFGALATDKAKGFGFGMLYGVIWWFLGPLTIMPLKLGMGLQLSATGMANAIPSLFGHLMWGIILGVVYAAIAVSDKSAVENVSKRTA